MIKLLLGVIGFASLIYCLIDAIVTPADRTRFLPKVAWVLLVLFFPFVGSIIWLVVGRPQQARPSRDEEFLSQRRFGGSGKNIDVRAAYSG